MTEQVVVIKGTKNGLCLIVNEGYALQVVKEKIQEIIAPAQSFFQGIREMKIMGTSLSEKDLEDLKNWMEASYEIKINNRVEKISQEQESNLSVPIHKEMTKYIYHTLRSGSKVQFNGSIVIIGDVNPGAEVIATGNITVMGALRGVAHAGILGNRHASVVAFLLQPTQLRIANIISRSPDEQTFKPTCPEKACISGDQIIIIPYYKNI